MCVNPYKVAGKFENNKLILDWKQKINNFEFSEDSIGRTRFLIPCGKCHECQRSAALAWTYRQIKECEQYKENCFLTLTYAQNPYNVSLEDITLFLKRLRERVYRLYNKRIRFFYCAEYGSKKLRPHYHLNIFNFCPDDLEEFFTDKQGNKVYKSSFIADCWAKGFVTVGKVTAETAFYTTLYMQKSRVEIADRVPVFRNMSRRPGLGASAVSEIDFNADYSFIDGRRYSIPRYYIALADRLGVNLNDYKERHLKKFVENQKNILKTFDSKYEMIYNEFDKRERATFEQLKIEV